MGGIELPKGGYISGPYQGEAPKPEPDLGLKTMKQIRKEALIKTLTFTRGDKKQAARILDVSVMTIYGWVDEFGLQDRFRIYPKSCR